MVCRKNDVLGSIVLKNVQILRFVRREPPHRLRGAGIGAIIKYGYLSAKGARGVSSNLYELLALAMRYVFAALMVLIVLRAARITAVDSRRARRLRRLSPQTGIVGEMLVMDGGERARPGMRYPVTLEGAIGSSRRADIRLRHSSVRARHAFYQMTDEGLFVRSHAVRQRQTQSGRLRAREDIPDGGRPHFDPGVTFAQQPDGILFDHTVPSVSM